MTPKDIAAVLPLTAEHKAWLEQIRLELVKRMLITTRGNQSEAARQLGIHRRTIQTMLEHPIRRKPGV